METYADRLKHAIGLSGMTQSELARRVGIHAQAVQYVCSGRGQRAGYTVEFARALGVSAEWLATGEGPMLADTTTAPPGLTADERQLLDRYRRLTTKEQAALQAAMAVLTGEKPS